jgi:PD-(D/E)XK nuclease superfamily
LEGKIEMKKMEYLSPTSIRLFTDNITEFYLNYLSDNRPAKFPQTKPMSVGSAFDAYAKSFLHERLFGKGNDPRFELQAIFEAQVEEQHRDWAYEAGKHVFEEYRQSGALSDLLIELGKAVGEPKFELEVRGVIDGQREGVTLDIQGVIFLGKPDVFFMNGLGVHVILDWKVNGYCSHANISPMQGYVGLREKKDGHWRNKGSHKEAQIFMHNGVAINCAGHLEDFDEDWARQLAIYGWLLGEDIGSDFIVAIDQVVCKPNGERPSLRFAQHRTKIRKDYQWKLYAEAQHIWEVVHSDHIFRDLSKEESIKKCIHLDGMKEALEGDGSDNDKWFSKITRGL